MRVVLVTAVAFLITCAPAAASVDSDLNALGDRVWGPAPCGDVRTVWADPPDFGVPDAAGWADPESCAIYLSIDDYPLPGPYLCDRWLHERGHIAGYYNPVGSAIRDDQGNVIGRDHEHSPDPKSIMYPELAEVDGWVGARNGGLGRRVYSVDLRCARFGLRLGSTSRQDRLSHRKGSGRKDRAHHKQSNHQHSSPRVVFGVI